MCKRSKKENIVKPVSVEGKTNSFPLALSKKSIWLILKEYALSILGGLMYAVAMNGFILPLGIYIGNSTGIAQIVHDGLRLIFPNLKDILGLIFIALNLPLLIISFASINKHFFLKTVLTVTALSVTMQVMPVKLLINGITEPITYVLIGGVLAGFGIGFSLRNGGSTGGTDILGVYLSIKHKGFSIGRVNVFIAMMVYAYALFNISPAILVYSILFTLVSNFVIDRVHFQNIKQQITIITKEKSLLNLIVERTGRSATYWVGHGAYANTESYVVITVLSKYEVEHLRSFVLKKDPGAFVIESDRVNVNGYFPAHFFN